MESTVVSGASGFVARNLLPLLVETGVRSLVLIDRHPVDQIVLGELRALGAKVTERISERPSEDLLEMGSADTMICLAGTTSVDAALADPHHAISGNIAIANCLGEWARRHPRPRIIYMSSDEVLGASSRKLSESSAHNPTQPYAASKAAAETIVHAYRDVYGCDVVTLRSCNLVGPGQRAPKLIPVTVSKLLNGEPVPIHGLGTQRREWMDVRDLCDAILRLIRRDVKPGVYQAASGKHYSVMTVARMVANAIGRPLRVEHVTDRLVQDSDYSMSSNLLRRLGWQPKINPRSAIIHAARAAIR